LGFYDDYAKILKQSGGGTPPRVKLITQIALATFVGIYLWNLPALSELHLLGTRNVWHSNLVSSLMLPCFKYPIHVGAIAGVVVVVLAIVGSSNAVNLTDGLDGLAIGCTIIAAGALTVLTYVSGHVIFADYLELQRMPMVSEVTVFCGAMTGASIGFLWYNAHPAEIFMGDVGSLALGGAIATVAVVIKQELLLPFIGGVFVVEAVSVILQVGSFKLRGKRIFKMAPVHHHFEALGWKESKIIVRFWIAGLVLALFALTTLKLR
jgi:phospho-N-acetylmuramoyl-pentapeptide-transferase